MIGSYINILLRLVLVVLAQVWVLDHVVLWGTWIVLFIYPYFLIKLPFTLSSPASIILGFLSGALVDLFTGTYGLMASAGVLVGYVRPKLIAVMTKRGEVEDILSPSIYAPGARWFTTFVVILCLLQSIWYFNISQSGLQDAINIQVRALLSGLSSAILCILTDILFSKKRTR